MDLVNKDRGEWAMLSFSQVVSANSRGNFSVNLTDVDFVAFQAPDSGIGRLYKFSVCNYYFVVRINKWLQTVCVR